MKRPHVNPWPATLTLFSLLLAASLLGGCVVTPAYGPAYVAPSYGYGSYGYYGPGYAPWHYQRREWR